METRQAVDQASGPAVPVRGKGDRIRTTDGKFQQTRLATAAGVLMGRPIGLYDRP